GAVSRGITFQVIRFKKGPILIVFFILGHLYVVILNPGTDIFDPYAQIRLSDGISLPIDATDHYRGYLQGNPHQKVVLSRIVPSVYIGMISAGNDSVYIEPASLHFESADQRDILVFRSGNLDGNSIFRGLSEDGILAPVQVNMVARVNEIYTVVNWDEGQEETELDRGRFVNMGFSIKELKILDKPSNQPGHYNSRDVINNGVWNSNRLLEAFTREEGSPSFCLVHLLTAQSFADSAHIGLAYVADTRGGPGGICSESTLVLDRQISFNTVFTSAIGNTGLHDYPLVTKEAEIVVAHEYAHSWGAQHDGLERDAAGREECLPDYSEGGNYIMHMYAQNGYDPNNIRFSPCSRKSIRRMLERRWHRCFEPEKASFCGNGVVEEGEDCDEGNFLTKNGSSKCCTTECRLAPSAQCSPHNQPCCNATCSYHPADHICLPGDPLQCKASSYCTGHSGECPSAPAIANGSPCIEEGECQDGVCLPYCERKSIAKKSCICEEVSVPGPIIQSNIVAIIVLLSIAIYIPIGCCIKRADNQELLSSRRAGRVRTVDVTRPVDL
ncbi:unnamed protein product, partial [Haemonchus placei]|uniref:Peptidase M12B domain-containing protein n=1 Tax=Haemonchus placei TaxID=6290 RepID=A0A0N4WY20_HAEPC